MPDRTLIENHGEILRGILGGFSDGILRIISKERLENKSAEKCQ